jgi:hypothetical protein
VPIGDTVALTSTGRVVTFNRTPSSALTSNLAVRGLAAGETIIGMDLRPSSSTIFAVTNQGAVYKLDPATGQATAPVTLRANATTPTNTCTPAVTAFTALAGTEFGVDFNPVPDRLRVVSNTGQNLRINPETGDTTVDCPLATSGTARTVSATAYTNSVPGGAAPTSTTQFYIDAGTDQLFTTTAPNNGELTVVGALGVDADAVNGFDITGATTAHAVLTVGGTTGFYSINLNTGAATVIASFSSTGTLRGLALR